LVFAHVSAAAWALHFREWPVHHSLPGGMNRGRRAAARIFSQFTRLEAAGARSRAPRAGAACLSGEPKPAIATARALLRRRCSRVMMWDLERRRQSNVARRAPFAHFRLPSVIVYGCFLKDPVAVVHIPAPGCDANESPVSIPTKRYNRQRCGSKKQRGHIVPFQTAGVLRQLPGSPRTNAPQLTGESRST
jgi:hypothetical protein